MYWAESKKSKRERIYSDILNTTLCQNALAKDGLDASRGKAARSLPKISLWRFWFKLCRYMHVTNGTTYLHHWDRSGIHLLYFTLHFGRMKHSTVEKKI